MSPDSAGMLTWTLHGVSVNCRAVGEGFGPRGLLRVGGFVHILRLVDGLDINSISHYSLHHSAVYRNIYASSGRGSGEIAYLVRESKRELDLIRGNVGVASSCQGSGESSRAGPDGCASDTE